MMDYYNNSGLKRILQPAQMKNSLRSEICEPENEVGMYKLSRDTWRKFGVNDNNNSELYLHNYDNTALQKRQKHDNYSN